MSHSYGASCRQICIQTICSGKSRPFELKVASQKRYIIYLISCARSIPHYFSLFLHILIKCISHVIRAYFISCANSIHTLFSYFPFKFVKTPKKSEVNSLLFEAVLKKSTRSHILYKSCIPNHTLARKPGLPCGRG